MRKIVLILYSIFIINVVTSQEINYIPYYHAINKANLAKCRQKYDSALIYYWQAFQMVDYILMWDLVHFAECAAIEKKDTLIDFVMEQCVKQTIPVEFVFRINPVFDQYKNSEKWQWCREQEEKNGEKYLEKYSCPYKQVMDSLLIEDQKIRTVAWRLTKKRHQKGLEIEYSNRRVIDELIAKYDYPNERNGLSNQSCAFSPMIIIFHYDDSLFFQNVEYKALIEGKLTPFCYARKAHRVAVHYNLPRPRYQYRYSPKMTEEEKAQVDKNRYEIGLPTIEEDRLMIQCNYEESLKRKEYREIKEKQNKEEAKQKKKEQRKEKRK